MNLLQLFILIAAVICSALIVWHELPLEIPWVIFKMFMLIVKLFLVLAVAAVAYIFAGRMKKSSRSHAS
jgi:hypothetical protein